MTELGLINVFNPEHTFDPPGCCIYCGSSGDPHLHREHIIPSAIRGRLVLSKASCQSCGGQTHAFEGRVIDRLFGGSRHVSGLKATKKETLPIFTRPTQPSESKTHLHYDLDGFERVEVAPDEHPGGSVGFEARFPPRILTGQPPWDDEFSLAQAKMYVPNDFQQRVKKLGLVGKRLLFGGRGGSQPMYPEDLARFLCKIAHAYAVSLYGIGSFIPFLTPAIRGERPMYLSHYVGRIQPWEPFKADQLHVLQHGIRELGGRRLLMVRIRLLAVDNYPAYDVIVGEATKATLRRAEQASRSPKGSRRSP